MDGGKGKKKDFFAKQKTYFENMQQINNWFYFCKINRKPMQNKDGRFKTNSHAPK